MREYNFKRNILCIDLKSFFASCECIERGLNPFSYPLVVASKRNTDGAITLAITPYLKAMGIKSRSRLYEIPKDIKYDIVPPRMNLYISKSKEIIDIYLDFVSKEDLHVYSIDECFLDVTNYLKLYNTDDFHLAKMIMNTIYKKTGLTATCGIGPNMLMAKVAMDIESKHCKNNIAKWTYEDVEKKLWEITPISKMWGIGFHLEKRLNELGLYKIKDIALCNKYKLKEEFGVIGEELWEHANGIDTSTISKFNSTFKNAAISMSQVLYKDYNEYNIDIILKEMTGKLIERLKHIHKKTKVIALGITYSKDIGMSFYHSIKLDNPTDDFKIILNTFTLMFQKYYDNNPIRKVSLSFSSLVKNDASQLSLFDEIKISKKDPVNEMLYNIKRKFGNNSIIKGTSLLKDSTEIEQNKKIGGHKA